MDIHRLRVVKFDNTLDEDITDKRLDDVCEDKTTEGNAKISKYPSENNFQTNLFHDINLSLSNHTGDKGKEIDSKVSFQERSRDDPGSGKTYKPYISKYGRQLNAKKREAKKEREKNKHLKKSRKQNIYKYRNTKSFEHLIKTISSKNNEYFTHIQNNLQMFRKHSNLIPMHTKPKENKHKRKLPNEVKVLYMSQTATYHNGTRKHYPNKPIRERNLLRRVKSFSSHDNSGFYRNRHIYNPNMYSYNKRPYDVHFCSSVLRKNKRYAEHYRKYHPRSSSFKIRRVKSNISDEYKLPMHFTLVDFPTSSNRYCAATSCIKLYDDTGDRIRRSYKDEEVSVKPSRFQISKKTLCDAAVLTSRSVQSKHLRSCQSSAHKCKKFAKNAPIISYTPPEIFNKMVHHSKSKHCDKNDSVLKVIIKYFLVGSIIVVWLPCVSLVGLLWLMTYPMRPHYVSPKLKDSYTNCKNENNKKGFLSPFINFAKQIAKDTFCSLNAIGGMIKSDDKACKKSMPSCRSPYARSSCCTNSHPDPSKKYTLFYGDKRGWMMKPIRRRNGQTKENKERFQNKICRGFNRFYQKYNMLNKDKLLITSVNEIKKYESSPNKMNSNCPCVIKCPHNNTPSIIVSDMIRSAQASGSQKKVVKFSQKPTSSKKSRQIQKYNDENKSAQSPPSKAHCETRPCGCFTQQASLLTKSEDVGRSSSANKSHSRHSPPEQLPTSPCCRRPTSAKYFMSKSTSSPHLGKISKKHKRSGSKCPPKEVSLTVAKDTRKTQTTKDNKIKKSHQRKCKLEKATKRIEIKATRRCTRKESQCNLPKHSPTRASFRKQKAKPKKPTFAQRVCCIVKTVCAKFKSFEDDDSVDVCGIKCHDLYLHTLRKRPCFSVYKCCPSIYPFFLIWRKCTMDCFHIMMYVCSICVWTPIFLSCYFCYWLCCCFFR